jgi:predicted ATPase
MLQPSNLLAIFLKKKLERNINLQLKFKKKIKYVGIWDKTHKEFKMLKEERFGNGPMKLLSDMSL